MADPSGLYDRLREEVSTVLIGKEDIVEGLTIALLTRGHVLLEGVPGVAKTTAAHLFALVTDLEYSRIQMTPDILPADITGTHVYRERTGEFSLHRGPIFANVVVADEINRATPKTQSALLEAMQERRVTIEGDTMGLPEPFLVIATQNPIELEGTFELPEAQRDRFQQKLTVDLPERGEELELLDRFDADPTLAPEQIEPVVTPTELIEARSAVAEVYVDQSVKRYILDLVAGTREHVEVEHGGSPRASLAFLNIAKARAAIQGRDYVIPDDVKSMARAVLTHRLVLSTDAELSDVSSDEVIADVIDTVEAPGGVAEFDGLADDGTPAVSDGGDLRDEDHE